MKAISGVQTVRFKNELERNITIKLGYANAKIYKCADARCPRPACYKAYSSSKEDSPKCDVPGAQRWRPTALLLLQRQRAGMKACSVDAVLPCLSGGRELTL